MAFRSDFMTTIHSQPGMGFRARKARGEGRLVHMAKNVKPASLLARSTWTTWSARSLYFPRIECQRALTRAHAYIWREKNTNINWTVWTMWTEPVFISVLDFLEVEMKRLSREERGVINREVNRALRSVALQAGSLSQAHGGQVDMVASFRWSRGELTVDVAAAGLPAVEAADEFEPY